MASRYTTFSYDEPTHDILTEMEHRNLRKSGVIRDLLKFFHEHDYQIPWNMPTKAEQERDIQRQAELDAGNEAEEGSGDSAI